MPKNQKKDNFFERNKPIFILGGVTVATFILIIFLAQFQKPTGPDMVEVKEEQLISDYSPIKWNPDASVQIVEFSDFQCPACASSFPIGESLLEKYKDDIYIGFRHFPLPQHPDAKLAAVASQAANKQGKFWEYAKVLFENQNALKREKLVEYAKNLGLDVSKFESDLNNQQTISEVNQDLAFGTKINIQFTPSFFVNGRLVTTNLEEEVKKELGVSNLPVTNPKIETQESSATQAIDDNYGVIQVEYTQNGFAPKNTNGVKGQLIRWLNKTENDITVTQKPYIFPEIANGKIIKAGESFEIRLIAPNLKDTIWTFTEKTTGNFGSVLISVSPKTP